MNSVSIIGGSDGPTSIFLAGKTGVEWLNIFGLLVIVFLMIPNCIYGISFRGIKNKCHNKVINIVEQIGRYTSMFLMIFNIGIAEAGFKSVTFFIVYAVGNILLLIAYWIVWMLFFIKQDFKKSMSLAIIPTTLFLLNGITLQHYLLVISAVIFGIGHLYVTYQNTKK